MLYTQIIISREPGLIHGQSSVTRVFHDALKNSNDPFYAAIRQEAGSWPVLARHLDAAVTCDLRENPSDRNIETATDK